MNRKFSLEKVKANQAKVAQGLLGRDDELRRAAPLGPLLEGRREAELPLADISDRRTEDARPLDPTHLVTLAESISRLGLITPITVDRRQCLIAGGHRRAALRLLALPASEREHAFRVHVDGFAAAGRRQPLAAALVRSLCDRLHGLPQRLGPVPVYVMAVDAGAEPELALRIEVAENEHRTQYTRDQVLALARRLRDSGIKDTPGRPKAGERSLRPELIEVFGISRATVTRYLRAAEVVGRRPEVPRPARFARLRRELRVALPLMTGEVASTALRLEEQLGAAVAGFLERERRLAERAADPLAESLHSALAVPPLPAEPDSGGGPQERG